jgi:uncharacterized Zn-binding protein involved in type VI secretion
MPLCSVQGDPNTHGAGELIATNPQTVFINSQPVIIHGPDHASGDEDDHDDPMTAEGSPNVYCYGSPVHRQNDPRDCGAVTVVEGQFTVFANEGGSGGSAQAVAIVVPSKLFVKPDTPMASDNQPYIRTSPRPTRAQNEQAGTAPDNPGVSESPPIKDQPDTKCDDNKPNVLGFLSQALAEAGKGTWRETGQNGAPSNPTILNMWKNIGLSYNSDQVPWCAGFACFAMKQSGLKWIRDANAYNLANLLGSGSVDPGYKTVSVSDMKPGDLVLWGSGHVSFCYTASGGKYTFVGGNQSPGKNADPPVRDPQHDGDVTISWPTGWTPGRGGITKVVRLDC